MCGWYYPDSYGGTERYVRSLAGHLAESGFEVSIAAPATDDCEREYQYEGVSVYRYPIAKDPSVEEVRGDAAPRYLSNFQGWLKRVSPDLVHMHSLTGGCGYYHALAIREIGMPLALTLHTPDATCARGTLMLWGKEQCDGKIEAIRCTACVLHSRGLPLLLARAAGLVLPAYGSSILVGRKLGSLFQMKGMIDRRTARLFRLMDMAERIFVVSQWQMNLLQSHGIQPPKVTLCRHGIDAERKHAAAGEKRGSLRIAFVGRVTQIKGPDIVIKAVKSTPRSIPLRLELWGSPSSKTDHSYSNRLKEIAAGDDRIVFCGQLKDEDRAGLWDTIDAVVVPSQCVETGPLVALEALASGIPVIGSNLGGITELVVPGKNGILLPHDNVNAWTECFVKVYADPDLLRRLSNGQHRRRSSRDVADEMSTFYRNFVGSTAGALSSAAPL